MQRGARRTTREETLAALMEGRRGATEFALEAVRAGGWTEGQAVIFIREVANQAAAAWGLDRAAAPEVV